jgi:prevent-host-death family protein
MGSGPATGEWRTRIPVSGADRYRDHMVRIVTATEAKATILALLEEVAAGEEVEITKRGRAMARLVPASGPQSLKGRLAGVAMTADRSDDLLTTGADWSLE